ncbi:MAG: hypothetical protein JJT96_01180 [Opitutales bacterium]|nr:hypothetical protein [Opitutales bacterium]
MLAKSLFLRLTQVVATVAGVYIGLIAGTFHVGNEPSLALTYFLISAALLGLSLLLLIVIRVTDPEMVSEVGWVIYPGGIALSLVGAFFFSVHLLEHLENARREHHTLILAGLLLTLFFVIRIFDIKWLKSARDVYRIQKRFR